MKGSVNTSMIVLAREARGVSQMELAEKIKMSATNLSKIERNEIGISEEVLAAIAEQTGFPLNFFKREGTIIPENLIYRKRESVAQKLLTPINANSNIIRMHVQFLTRALQVKPPNFPLMSVSEILTPQKIAIRLRQKWEITNPVIENLTRVIENKGLVIASFNFGTGRVDSRSIFTDDKYPVIIINNELLCDRYRFSLAYELGHLIMHTHSAISLTSDIVSEANAFAAEFLMPAQLIQKDFEKEVTIPALAELKRKWKVSMIALLYRAEDLGYITANQKRYLLQQFNSLNIRRREPIELDLIPEHPQLMRKWIADYRKKTKLGVVEMAAIFCLHTDEFLELYL